MKQKSSESNSSRLRKSGRSSIDFSQLYPVILAGGSGSRLWPESSSDRPKQFLALGSKRTMIEETFRRIVPPVPAQNVWVVTSEQGRKPTRRQLPDLGRNRLLVEPTGRNTAPAIGWAATELVKIDPEAVMLVLPADHVIEPVEAFRDAVRLAMSVVTAEPDVLVVFGIPPLAPSTQFGYIEYKRETPGPTLRTPKRTVRSFAVASFHEKPDELTAARYLARGSFCWNSGMFVWKASRILELLERFEPELFAGLERIGAGRTASKGKTVLAQEYQRMKKIQIDRAVLERADNIVLVESPFCWNDLGSFESLAMHDGDRDPSGNIVTGKGVILHRSSNNIVRQTVSGKRAPIIALLGVEDLVVVQTSQAVLVCKKSEQAHLSDMLERGGIAFKRGKKSDTDTK